MTELLKLTLTKADLATIPPDERPFSLMAQLACNDINVLGKLLIIATNDRKLDDVPRWAQMTQTFLLVRLLAGRLFEANEQIKALFLGKKLRAKYIDELNPKAKDGLENLNRYFGRRNPIERVRNVFAFHMGAAEIEQLYAELPEDFRFTSVLSEAYQGNSLFYGAEILAYHAVAKELDQPDMASGLDVLMQDTVQVSMWMGNFLTYFVVLMFGKFLGISRSDMESIALPGEVRISDLRVPFFAGPPARS